MTVTTTDIANRALQLVGLQKKVTSLTQDSVEAQAVSVGLAPIQSWCFGLANWNFARRVATLTSAKGPVPSNPSAWTNTYPPPPWLSEFTLPADFVRAIYITNSDPATGKPGYLGEPKRFVIGNDTVSAVQQAVLLTNESAPILTYTGLISDPTEWPWYFERLAVIALAHGICMSLTNSLRLLMDLGDRLEQQISVATQMNQIEGLLIPDTTPEWIQALGINYPYRRSDGKIDPTSDFNHPLSGGIPQRQNRGRPQQ